MGYLLLVGNGRIVDVERRLDERTHLFYYIVKIGRYDVTFRGNPSYAGGGKFLIPDPDDLPDDLPESLFGEISDAIEKIVT